MIKFKKIKLLRYINKKIKILSGGISVGKPGLRIRENIQRVSKDIVEQFKDAEAAMVADCSFRLFAMNASISPMGKGKKIIGPALTVKAAIADNSLFHKALFMAKPGDVIVVDACGDVAHSVCGDVMFRYAISKGIAGIIIDGCIRDVDFLLENDFPVYAKGVTPRGPYKTLCGEINFDIACGGQVVHPGDLVVADADGVTIVAKDDAIDILEKLNTIKEKEALMGAQIEAGIWDDESELLQSINKKMREAGFETV